MTTVTVTENENATLPCTVPAQRKAVIIVWKHGQKNFYKRVYGSVYGYSNRKKKYTLTGAASIFLYGADRNDHGIYTCIVKMDGIDDYRKEEVNLIVKCKYIVPDLHARCPQG